MLLPIKSVCDMQKVTSNAWSQYLSWKGGQEHPIHIQRPTPLPLLTHIPKKHLKCSFSHFLLCKRLCSLVRWSIDLSITLKLKTQKMCSFYCVCVCVGVCVCVEVVVGGVGVGQLGHFRKLGQLCNS